jgi:hypothetical protein
MGINFNKLILPVPKSAAFKMDDYIVWCGTMVQHDDGLPAAPVLGSRTERRSFCAIWF